MEHLRRKLKQLISVSGDAQSFLRGFGSNCLLPQFYTQSFADAADSDALRSDWRAIANDLVFVWAHDREENTKKSDAS